MPGRRVVVFVSAAELGPALAHLIASRAEKALSSGAASFSLGLSGGSLVSILSKELPAVPNLDCSRWLVGFCDERLVPFDDPESTYGLYKNQLFTKLNIPEERVLAIDPSLPVQQCAEDYARKLSKALDTQQTPVFDMLLLGMGPDGHTCSLFPDHPLLQEKQKTVAPISDSPKPPPQRVTLTLPVVNAAHCVVFVSTGGSKATVLKQVLEGGDSPVLPAALVAPTHGELFWLVDEPAAASLKLDVERPGPGAKL
ncbi:6-phosphogluconolactonase [Hemibagrus wyckioides]|uniref:6-phosphogluconolactonase n=1 Tax=Hemibagrus wyckioides TaxID=337641 RepID=UPI00266DC441|nr:6-phosphogluconolactonase [Hemibagrus wyckioides]XP_058233126.1 6-phosphogluconolactonase [Hemibagrus wyckioides]XP_058233127.1 6-phosphogluconolactonase [Hemibagrus wyckioides]XP_058233128.1 6-phosphogluconolactonase [Hemibagrus wyckioides]